jgi:preprotein translocase subunit SecF
MVTIILFLFLLNFRTTFITLMAMPLSFAVTMLVFKWLGISVNSMTLGGLAVAIGMVVDDAIVDVENVFRRLRETPLASARAEVIAKASGEVRNSILYATVLIILVFLPLLGLHWASRASCSLPSPSPRSRAWRPRLSFRSRSFRCCARCCSSRPQDATETAFWCAG